MHSKIANSVKIDEIKAQIIIKGKNPFILFRIPNSHEDICLPSDLLAVINPEQPKIIINHEETNLHPRIEKHEEILTLRFPHIPADSKIGVLFGVRRWVKVAFTESPRWKKTLEILSVNKASLIPSYISEASRKLEQIAGQPVNFLLISKFIRKILINHQSESISHDIFSTWLAGIIVYEYSPKFLEIRSASPIKNPSLPFNIISGDMAELLGIWSSDGTLTYVKYSSRNTIIPTFVVTSRDEKFIDTLDILIRRILGDIIISVDSSYRTKTQFRIRNKIFIHILEEAGALPGRKSDFFAYYNVPKWIMKKKEYIIRWFKGVLECDGDIKICHKKRTYAVRYSRNIMIELPREIINVIIEHGRENKLTKSYTMTPKQLERLGYYIRPMIPKIIRDEINMLRKILPKNRIRLYQERIFYYPKTDRSTLKWTIGINGKETVISCLKMISPPRLVKKAIERGLIPPTMFRHFK